MKDRSLRRAVDLRRSSGFQEAAEQTKCIQMYCQGNAFRNPDFPITLASLYMNGLYPKDGGIVAHHWRRALDVIPADPAERNVPIQLTSTAQPSDIVQGHLGNCWFLGALSLIAAKRECLDRVLLSRKLSECGAYHIRLAVAGEWKTTLVDDYLPCKKNGTCAYAWGRGRQLWVPLIEKAAAMVYGSWEALQAGSISEGLRLLTGCPCETILLEQVETLVTETVVTETISAAATATGEVGAKSRIQAADCVWSHLATSHATGQLLGVSSTRGCEAVGLMPHHAYAVVHIYNPRDGVRLLCLQDPHGDSEWFGNWSEASPSWDAAVRAAAPDGGTAAPGQFWISFEDVCALFTTVEICKVSNEWDSVRFEGNFPRTSFEDSTCFQIKPLKRSTLHVHLLQSEFRGSRDADLDLGLMILKVRPQVHVQDGELVAVTPRRVQPASFCELYLEDPTCTYVVLPLSFNKFGVAEERPGFKCDFHSTEPVLIERVSCPPELIGAAVTQHVISVGRTLQPFKDDKKEKMRVFVSDTHFVAENRSKTRSFEVKVAFDAPRSFTSSRVAMACTDLIPPGNRQLLCALTPLDSRVILPARYKFNFDSQKSKKGDTNKSKHLPDLDSIDMHAPRMLSDAGLGRVSKDRDPYSDYWGGGVADAGAFGGGESLSDEEIDAMLASFLRRVSKS
jgi:calpain-15